MPPSPLTASSPYRLLAEQALSRAAGAPLLGGNAVELLIDAEANYTAWLQAIKQARHSVLLENYIIRDDDVGRRFRDALVDRARDGVLVAVICDWMGCLGQSRAAFWKPLRDAGGEVRVFNPPQLGQSFGWISRDHRKTLVVDGQHGFLSGVCISAQWLGDADRGVPPWRDTGVALQGPAVGELAAAFADSWRQVGPPLPELAQEQSVPAIAGDIALRVIATHPSTAGMYRLDQLIAAMARRTLWLTDAYFVGMAPYVQALVSAARDGVDVRLLVPGSSDIPAVGSLSRSGYRPLLKAGIRVFEWNGSMLHAKTAVADGQWARVARPISTSPVGWAIAKSTWPWKMPASPASSPRSTNATWRTPPKSCWRRAAGGAAKRCRAARPAAASAQGRRQLRPHRCRCAAHCQHRRCRAQRSPRAG
ncbi:phosphatidylserine/phosphatidylglycerophosphate/cardiolipin synthase [Rhodanobacter sp. 115]|nr:phosphatidylserine/phosphatidylglycerophosphate/cardiolipin synthase [Rhodanobacter sp. 115]